VSKFRMVIAEADGRVLDVRDLTADAAFTYRVFAESTGEMHPFDGPIVDGTPHATGHPNGAFQGLHRAGCPSGISTKYPVPNAGFGTG